LIHLSFFLSGAAALLYEVLWIRQVTLLCGHTALAASAVTAAFMGGLALGAAFGGRAADRLRPGVPLRLYAGLELTVALAAALAKPALAWAGAALLRAGVLDLPTVLQPAAYFFPVFTLLLVPTCLMGATLPLLIRHLSGRVPGGPADAPVAALYGANTLGAVAGAAGAGLLLLPALGMTRTLGAAMALNAAAAGLAWLQWKRDAPHRRRAPARSTPRGSSPVPPRAAGLLFLTGTAAMICQVAWIRCFAVVLGSTIYALTAVLATFLLGLAGGSLAFRALRSRLHPDWGGLAALLAAISAAVFAGLFAFDSIPFVLSRVMVLLRADADALLAAQYLFAGAVMLPPTLLMGAVLPWTLAAWRPEGDRIGAAAGGAYAANTAGAITGAAGAGLLLLPWLDLERSLLSAVWLYAGAAILAGFSKPPAKRAWTIPAAAVLLAAAILLRPSWNRRLFTSGMFVYGPYFAWTGDFSAFKSVLEDDTVVFHKSGRDSTVTVLETRWGERYLRVNGKTDAGEGPDMDTQLLLGFLPSLIHRGRPRSALVVGLGGGLTAGALAADPEMERIDVVEIEPVVGEAARLFSRSNRRVLDDPRVSLHWADARQFLAAPGKRYDIITSEPSNPWIAGVAYLYTQEAFAGARDRLDEGGVYVHWLHSYFMSEDDFRMIARTFCEVFPHSMLLWNSRSDYFLVGSPSPWEIDYQGVVSAFADRPAMRQDLASLGRGFDHPFTFLTQTFAMGGKDLRAYAIGAALHKDDRPTLEFSAPRSLFIRREETIEDSLRSRRTTFVPDGLRGLHIGDREKSLIFSKSARILLDAGILDKAEEAVRRALEFDPLGVRPWTDRGRLLEKQGRPDEALAAYQKAAALDPREPYARLRLGAMLSDLGRPKEAEARLREALALGPRDPETLLELGTLLVLTDREREGRGALRLALEQPIPRSGLRRRLVETLEQADPARPVVE